MTATDTAPVGRYHPETAQDAAVAVAAAARTQEERVYDLIRATGPSGATAADVADAIGVARNQVAARIGALRDRGRVAAVVVDGTPVNTHDDRTPTARTAAVPRDRLVRRPRRAGDAAAPPTPTPARRDRRDDRRRDRRPRTVAVRDGPAAPPP